jgi:hypothetical protein
MNNIILRRYIGNINYEYDGELLNEGVLMTNNIEESEINNIISAPSREEGNEINTSNASNASNNRCICRYSNTFNLCNRNITNNSLYCRYHKNTKFGYIHSIFYDVFKEKVEITRNDLYMLYKYIIERANDVKDAYALYIELLKNMPFKILLNIAEKIFINANNRKYSKKELYNILYNININTYYFEYNNICMAGLNKIQDMFREKLKKNVKNKLKDNIMIKYDINEDYMNSEELFTGENICEIPINRLYVLKNERNEKYIFDAIELEYFIRKCLENKQEPYNPYNRDKLQHDALVNLNMFIKYNALEIKTDEYLWENNMHAFTELSLEIERRGFYNSPEWFDKLKDADFLKIIKYFKLFSSNIPECNKYFNDICADTLVYDFCKDAIKMFKECNDEYYVLCCNFIKAMALCSNNFFNNIPSWLIANNENIRINTNLETLMGLINRDNASELTNNFLLYYYVEHI